MNLTNEEYQFCEQHIELIKKIVRTSSSSYINPDYRDGLIALGKKYKIMNCSTCNTSLYLGTCRLFKMYEEDRVEKLKIAEAQSAPSDDVKAENNINNKEEEKAATKRKRNTVKK